MPKTPPSPSDEYRGLVVAALVLLVVLVVAFMALQLYNLHKNAPGAGPPARRDPFIATLYYSPSCGSEWLGRRRSECSGITTGVMPSIELTTNFGHSLCAGRLGVPP